VIDVQQVRELIELMVEHELSEIKVREGETAISLRKGATGVEVAATPAAAPIPSAAAAPASLQPAAVEAPSPDAPAKDDGLIPISSPMVGTYYSAPEPDSPPFVTVGSEVTADTTICVIEAMKVFNEIKAEVAGTVEEIVVTDQQAVEFGQPLMMVRPKG
jgi:acetyl-CoA carboxylase biotin carboxyl carrier protein